MSTLREILAKLAEGEAFLPVEQRTEWLDAELSIGVCDGHRNFESVSAKADFSYMPRSPAHRETGEPARLRFDVSVERHRLVKERGAA